MKSTAEYHSCRMLRLLPKVGRWNLNTLKLLYVCLCVYVCVCARALRESKHGVMALFVLDLEVDMRTLAMPRHWGEQLVYL